MKHLITFLQEDANSAKNIKLPYQSYDKKAEPAYILWEKIPQKNMNLLSYYRSFANPLINQLMKNKDDNYFRGFIINMNPDFLIFSWNGRILHEEIAKGLKSNATKLKYPNLDYPSLYESTLMGYFQKNWIFPVVYDNGTIRSNLTSEFLKKMNQEENIKALFKLSDSQWTEILKSAW